MKCARTVERSLSRIVYRLVEPKHDAELTLMVESMTIAMKEVGSAASMAMYDRAAEIYLERVNAEQARWWCRSADSPPTPLPLSVAD